MLAIFFAWFAAAQVDLTPSGSSWTAVGPYNIFNGNSSRYWGEAGTLASAASPKANPELIYAGGQNNGVSSGVIRTTDGGLTWHRKSRGLWDTRISAVWVHPDDPSGKHVFAGTRARSAASQFSGLSIQRPLNSAASQLSGLSIQRPLNSAAS